MPVNGTLSTTANRLWDVATKLAVMATAALVAVVISHEVRVSVIERTRFTEAEGKALTETIRADIVELKLVMRTMEREIAKLQVLVEQAHKED